MSAITKHIKEHAMLGIGNPLPNPLVLKNMVSNQWIWPQFTYHGYNETDTGFTKGRIYFGAVERYGGGVIVEIDVQSNEVKKKIMQDYGIKDDHNAPCIVKAESDRTYYFRANHGSDNMLRYGVQDVAGDLGSFRAEAQFDTGNTATYAQVYPWLQTTADLPIDLHMFFRSNGWNFAKLDLSDLAAGAGETPVYHAAGQPANVNVNENAGMIIEQNQIFNETVGYMTIMPRKGQLSTLRVASYQQKWNGGATSNLYIDAINITSGDFAGGNVRTGVGMPAAFTDMTEIYDGDVVSEHTRLYGYAYDTSSAVCHAAWSDAAVEGDVDASSEYRVAYLDGTWKNSKVCDAGATYNWASRYFGGMCFKWDDLSTVYVCREDSGTWYLEEYTSPDAGATWALNREIYTSSNILAQPRYLQYDPGTGVPVNLACHEISTYTSFTSWDSDLLLFKV